MLPSVAMARVAVKSIFPIPTSDPPKTITISLGDGGKMFSINAMKNIAI
jgi:hypothetical protein